MQDFAQFMAGVTGSGLDTPPVKGQAWQFADGRQGIVAAIDVTGATIYVGPESFQVPRGDWAVVFGAASLVLPPDAALAPVETTPIHGAGEHFPLGFGERFPPGGPPVLAPVATPAPAPALPSTIDVPTSTPPEPHQSRRNRKR